MRGMSGSLHEKNVAPSRAGRALSPACPEDLVIVGGGVGGTSAAEALMACLKREREDLLSGEVRSHDARFQGLSKVSFLTGGRSLAFNPTSGDFAKYLTVIGSETLCRDAVLSKQRKLVEENFAENHFSVRSGVFAEKIRLNRHGLFSITAKESGTRSTVTSRRLILALGHTLRPTPAELRGHIIRGAGELCRQLDEVKQCNMTREAAFDTFFSRFKAVTDETLSIGLVGFGASCLEVIKVFCALLEPPSVEYPYFRLPVSNRPVVFTLIDSGLARFFGSGSVDLMEYLRVGLEKIMGSREQGSVLTRQEEESFRVAAKSRIANLLRAGQLRVVPSKCDWSSIRLNDGIIECRLNESEIQNFSCIIDCAPFLPGVGEQHRETIKDLQGLTWSQMDGGGWKVQLRGEELRSTIGLVGAAFSPRSEWDGRAIFKQSLDTVLGMFPPGGGGA